MKKAALFIVLLIVAILALTKRPHRNSLRSVSVVPPAEAIEQVPVLPQTAYKCEGKTRCPEMRSCEEAKFYLQNCPGTVMDGDGDGIPCEGQWCGH